MKISFTCNNIGTGGAERVICNLSNRLVKDGHSVNIICYKKLDSFYYPIEKGVTIIELDHKINDRKSFISRKIAGIFNFIKLFKAIKGSDRVVSFYSRQNCYSIIACKLRRIPIICSERDSMFMNDSKINHLLRKILYPLSNGFIHQTNMARELLRKNEGVRCDDIVIPNPLWIKEYPKRTPIKGNIVCVGRLDEQKNYFEILDAFKLVCDKNENSSLNIYGDGILKNELIDYCKKLNIIDRVHFNGLIKNVVEALIKADIYVLFSHGEGYPNSLMEAMAMGVPSISSNCLVGGPKDMINDGINGFLVNCSDISELAKKILLLLSDESLKKSISKESIKIRETNDFEKIYNCYSNYIINIKGNKKN